MKSSAVDDESRPDILVLGYGNRLRGDDLGLIPVVVDVSIGKGYLRIRDDGANTKEQKGDEENVT